MNQNDKVSIIMPVYNSSNKTEEAIKSVLNQTYKNIELIVVENGPKEDVEHICKKLNYEEKIIYFYESKANVSNARNIALNNASGNYIAFIDSDDKYESFFLEKMLINIRSTNSQLVTCGYRTVYSKIKRLIKEQSLVENTNQIKEYLEILKEEYLFNEVWNKLYLAKTIKENSIKFDEKFELGEDFIFNLDYLKYVKQVSYVNEDLYIYTDGQQGLKLKYRPNKFEIEYSLTKKLEQFYKNKEWDMKYIYNRYARIYYNGIIDIFKKNNPSLKKEKNKQLDKFIHNKKYKEDLNFLKDKITDKKFKFAVNHFFLKNKLRIKLFIILNNIRKKEI